MTGWSWFFPRQAIQYHNNLSLCSYPWCQRSWSWSVLWRPRRPPRTNTKKGYSIHHWVLKCKSRKSRDTWNNRHVWLWSTKWSRAKVNRILPKEHTGHNKHPLPTTQEKTLQWTSPDGQYQNQIDYILCKGETLYSQQKQDWELTVAQIMNSLLPNSDLNWGKWGKPLDHSGTT